MRVLSAACFVFFVMFLISCGENSGEQKSNPTTIKDSSFQHLNSSPAPDNSNKGLIIFQWDSLINEYYYAFHDEQGNEIKRVTSRALIEADEFNHLPFPTISQKDNIGSKEYNLRLLTSEQKQGKLKDLKLKITSLEDLSRTHWILYGAGSRLHDGINYRGRYLIVSSNIMGIDSTSEIPTFTKTVIKILNSKGEQIGRVEDDNEHGSIGLSDDARFLLMEDTKIHLDPTHSYVTRKPFLLHDLKEKKKYQISIENFNENITMGGHNFIFQNGRYFGFALRDQSTLHILIDPYYRMLYTKEYPEGYKNFSNPDLNIYTKKAF